PRARGALRVPGRRPLPRPRPQPPAPLLLQPRGVRPGHPRARVPPRPRAGPQSPGAVQLLPRRRPEPAAGGAVAVSRLGALRELAQLRGLPGLLSLSFGRAALVPGRAMSAPQS